MLLLCLPSLLAAHLFGPRHKKSVFLALPGRVTAPVPLALSSSFLGGSCEALGHRPEDSDKNDQRPGMTSPKEETDRWHVELGHSIDLRGCTALLQRGQKCALPPWGGSGSRKGI